MKVSRPSDVTLALVAAVALLAGLGCSPDATEAHQDHHQAPAPVALLSPKTCAVHGARIDLCFICDASLRQAGRLWCNEHHRYEDRCWTCHPEARDANRSFCDEHGLYEDECFLCRPELAPTAPAAAAQAPTVLFCEEHGVPEAECGICHPEVLAQLAPGAGTQVRLPSVESARRIGLQTALPVRGTATEGIDCLAEIGFNQNQLAEINAPVGGIVQSVEIDLGHRVIAGQTVARLWSATIAESVAKAVLTHQTLDRERRLRAGQVTSEKDLQEAEAEHRAACQQLRTLGFSEAQIDDLGGRPAEAVLLDIRAPFAGEIVARTAVRGALVEVGKPLFVVANRETMWADLSLPETALARVAVGQPVELAVDALPGRSFTGRLTWIDAGVDERTRMARARVEIPNPDGVLRDKMFGRARIQTRRSDGALLLPESALQYVEGRPIVFVQLGEDLFEARVVGLGARQGSRHEITAGLHPADRVVDQRSFALKSHLLSSRLGAGCAHE